MKVAAKKRLNVYRNMMYETLLFGNYSINVKSTLACKGKMGLPQRQEGWVEDVGREECV